jgi:hypothetical protein
MVDYGELCTKNRYFMVHKHFEFKKLLVALAIILLSLNLFSQEWHYEITCAGTGVQGTYLVEVTSYGKTVDAALAQMKKDAVHGVLFRGLTGKCTQKPLTGKASVETEHKEFFDKFFGKSGDYAKYVVDDPGVSMASVKVGKQYKVTKVLSVKKDMLRRDLENAGIIKALGF